MTDKRKPPRRWTGREDALLREAIAKYDSATIDWQEVATHLEGRTNKDCRKRWVYALRTKVTKGPWGQDEDERLEAGVKLHGCRWNKVAEVVGTRQADQCSRRWHECRNPIINRSRWSLLEDSTLECAVRVYGRNWTEIVERFFYDRTPIAAKNRYKQRFEKGSNRFSSIDANSPRNQDQQTPPLAEEEERPSPASSSSAFEGNDDNINQSLPWESWPAAEPRDFSSSASYYHLPAAPYIPPPTNLLPADGNLMSPLGSSSSSGISRSGFASSLEQPSRACSLTDVIIPPSGSGMYYAGTKTKSIPDTLYLPPNDESGFATGLLNHHMTLSDIEEAFRELCTGPSPGGGFGAADTNVNSPPRRDYHSVSISSTSGLATAAPMPDWRQLLSNSLSLDQMIRQLASYRVQHAAGVWDGEYPATQIREEGFVADQDVGGGMAW